MRYILLGSVAYALTLVLGVVLRWFGEIPGPDIALLFVLYVVVSRRGSAPAQAAFALTLGYLCDVLSGGPRGVQTFTLTTIALLGRPLGRRLDVRGLVAETLIGLGGSVASLAIHLLVGIALFTHLPTFSGLSLLSAALVTGVLTGPMFALGRRLDGGLGLRRSTLLR